ncbi:MAG: hypothetical protein ACKO9Z_03365 [Planctomycetota bacterium]|jgi:hypothetical protein|nr:hypothetical protein [Planctomycetota bacterium]
MSFWHRVFARSEANPDPVALAELAQATHAGTTCHFGADNDGWFSCEIRLPDGAVLNLDRYLAEEEGVRRDLNTWAAWIETCDYSDRVDELMEWVIQSRQFFTLRRPLAASNDLAIEKLSTGICRHLALVLDGIWQADGEGLYDASGEKLLQEY